jgi:hypothetical protein
VVTAELTIGRLLSAGFQEIGCWELNSERDLIHRIELPSKPGVYAFAIDGIVQYVGLASKSLRQRLGFYRKPVVSQATNIRLNEIIRGRIHQGMVVQILTAHPPDHKWNGLRISGAEGLEAGLIADFDLPWNMRGSRRLISTEGASSPSAPADGRSGGAQRVMDFVKGRPGMTELQIAKSIYGSSAIQQQVNADCRLLVERGQIERRGAGGPADPFIYYPAAQKGSDS